MWKVHIKTICGQKQPDTAWKVSVFVVILIPIFPYSDQNNSKYGHFLCSARSRNEACNFIKKETPTHRWIFQNSKNTFLAEHLRETAFLGDFNFPAVLRNLSRAFEKRLWHRWFPVNFANFFKNSFFYRTASGDCFRRWFWEEEIYKINFTFKTRKVFFLQIFTL